MPAPPTKTRALARALAFAAGPAKPAVPAAPRPGLAAGRAWLAAGRRIAADPRHLQILALGTLLIYGIGCLHFEVSLAQVSVTVSTALAAQWLFTRILGGKAFDARSALISALSLCLLLRVEGVFIAALGTALAIASKFVLRWHGTHVFNPSAFAISVLLLATDAAWTASGQWGHAALVLLVVAGLGLMVLTRAQRVDIALAFAAAWSALIVARSWWYHDPLHIAMHQLSNGAVVLFCLFMLTDPRTTPRSRGARVLFAVAVAALGATINFGLYRADGLILALALCAPLTPLLNALQRSTRRPRAIPARHVPFTTRRTS